MRIQHNITAMNSYRNFSNNTSKLNKNLEKLASGYKINRAGDDAAGLAISEKMRAQISGLEGATKNAKDGISLIQTAEGALTEVHDMLNRMVTLAEQSANGTYQDELDREQLQKEVQNLKDEIDRVADSTNYNGIQLLNGDLDYAKETTTVADSAISNISTKDYAAKGKSDVFSIDEESVKVRDKAVTTQVNAQFNVNLDASSFSGLEEGDKITLKIGGETMTLDVVSQGATAGKVNKAALTSASDLAAAFRTGGGKAGVTANTATDSMDSQWTASSNAGNMFKVGGHYYTMAGSGSTITFTQADTMASGTGVVDPDYEINLGFIEDDAKLEKTGAVQQGPQDHVQVTQQGQSVGSSKQAEIDLKLDFSKLKDGDKLTAGDRTLVFKVGVNSTTTASTTDGETLIDLSDIMKETADLSDAAKQSAAMVKIVGEAAKAADGGAKYAGPSVAWTMGNGGVTGGIGTLSFQSLSTYDEFKTAGNDTTTSNARMIGTGVMYRELDGQDASDVVDMTSASNIVKQFFTESKETDASTSFDMDVTKIKVGDTFTLDGTTFEFTDGANSTVTGGVAIDLSSMGVSNGLLASQRSEVFTKVKDTLDQSLQSTVGGSKVSKYDFTSSGNTITLTSKDDTSTNSFENRVAADLSTPSETTYGKGLVLQIGDTSDDYNMMSVSVSDMHASALGIGDIDISTQDGASAALDSIKDAVNRVSDTRGNLGAMQNRLEHTINNLGVMRENVQNAESLIRDTDVAEEMMAYTKNNILNQSAQAMLAQANQLPQGVLQLLG